MAKIPYFPFYPDDWLSSLTIRSMSYAEQGIYFHLLCLEWMTDDCVLPNDLKLLKRWIHSPDKQCTKKSIQKVLEMAFRPTDDGWINTRLLQERQRAERLHNRACSAAKYRWEKRNENKQALIKHESSNLISTQQADENQNQNQNQNQKESKTLVQKEALNEGWKIFWKAYPKKQGKEKAKQKWMSLKPNAELLSEMLLAINQQKQTEQWQKDNGQFIPMPITWLNQKRWEDEIQGGVGVEDVKSRHDRIFGVRPEHSVVAGNIHREEAERRRDKIVDG